MERLLGQVALATFGYYLVTFAFEVGYFWDIGLDLLPAFSVSEHAIHAAAYILATVGVLVFVFASAHLLPLMVAQTDGAAERTAGTAEPPARATGRRRALALAMQAPALGVFVWSLADSLPAAARHPAPTTFWLALLGLAVSAYLVGGALTRPRPLWMAPTVLLAILSPVALGQLVFQLQTDGRSPKQVIKIGDRRIVGRTLLVGGTNLLLLSGERIYLTDQTRGLVVAVDLRRRGGL